LVLVKSWRIVRIRRKICAVLCSKVFLKLLNWGRLKIKKLVNSS
jgi:hypothetical protein